MQSARGRGAVGLWGILALTGVLWSADLSEKERREATLVFNTASRFYRQQNWNAAASSYSDFIRKFPEHEDFLEARFARGYSLFRLEKLPEAAEDFLAARRATEKPWLADADFYLGRSLERLASRQKNESRRRKLLLSAADGFGVAARRHLETWKRSDAKSKPKARDLWVTALAAQGESLEQAKEYSRAIVTLSPLRDAKYGATASKSYARGLYYLALSHYLEESKSSFNTPIEKNSKALNCLEELTHERYRGDSVWAEARYLRARLLHRSGSIPEAAALYENIANASTKHSKDASYQLGLLWLDEGSPDSIEKAIQALASHRAKYAGDDSSRRALCYAGLGELRLKKYDAAIRSLKKFIQSGGESLQDNILAEDALLGLGQAFLLKSPRDAVRAEAAIEAAILKLRSREGAASSTPRLAEAIYWLGESRLAQGGATKQVAAAENFREVAANWKKEKPALAEEALFKRGEALFQSGDYSAARGAAEEYRREYPRGQFTAATFELGASSILRAAGGSATKNQEEAAILYERASSSAKAVDEQLRLRFRAAVLRHANRKFARARVEFYKIASDLERHGLESRADFVDLRFYLADSIAQVASPESGVVEHSGAKDDLLLAASFFAEYRAKNKASDSERLATAVYNQGLCYLWVGKLKEALDLYAQFFESNPQSALAMEMGLQAADIERRLGRPEKAVARYLEVAKRSADDERALNCCLSASSLLREIGQASKAMTLLRGAQARFDKLAEGTKRKYSADLQFEFAAASAESGTPDASARLESFLAAHPKSLRTSEARLSLAYLQVDGGELEKAMETLAVITSDKEARSRDEALFLEGWAASTLVAELDSIRNAAAKKRMLASYESLLREYPDSPYANDARLDLAQQSFEAGNSSRAEELFSDLRRRLEPKASGPVPRDSADDELLHRALFGLAFSRLEAEKYDEARDLFDRVSRFESEAFAAEDVSRRATFRAGMSCMLGRKEKEAISRFEALLEVSAAIDDLREETLLRLAECRHRTREYAKSAQVARQLIKERPEGRLRPEAEFALGHALQNSDKSDEAIKAFRSVTTGTTRVVAARAQYHIGECYMDQGQYEKAANEFCSVVANFDFKGAYSDWCRRALLAAGIAYEANGKRQLASAQWKELIDRFPASIEARAAKKRTIAVKGENQ